MSEDTSKNTTGKGRGTRARKSTPKAKAPQGPAQPTTPIKDLREAIGSGNGEVVSYILGWALRDATGDYNALVELAAKAGLDGYLPSCPTHEARLRRSITKIKGAHGVNFRRMAADPDAPGWVTYRPMKATDKAKAAAVDPRFRQDQAIKSGAGVAVNTDTGEMVLEDPSSDLLKATAKVYTDLDGQFSHETISGWLHRVMERHFNAAPFPATGGAHIIPATPSTGEDLQALRGIVQSIGRSTLDFEGFNRSTTMASNAATGLLGTQWSTMVEELEGFLADSLNGDLTHPTGFTAKLAQAEALRGRMDLYTKILDRDKAGMVTALEAMTEATRTLLTATTEARSLAKAKGSELASKLAKDTVDKAAQAAQDKLREAKALWAPIHGTDNTTDGL